MKIEGKWVGQYTYGENYPANCIGKSIDFEMNLFSNGIEFYGNFSDDETRDLFQESGTVYGFIEGDFISFNKRYPKTFQITEDGLPEILENSIPPLIKYEGVLGDNMFEGNWEIQRHYLSDDGPCWIAVGTGTWSMGKSKAHN